MAALNRGWNILLTCCLVVLSFVTCPSQLTRASRLEPTASRTAFRSSAQFNATKAAQFFRAELVHRDHVDSPLRPPPGTTSAERFAAAATHSKARAAIARRQLGSEVADITPIFPGNNEYLMTIHLGTPPQKFTVIVDSGSDLVWVQCLPCNSPHVCFPSTDPFFDPTTSTSYATVPCTSSQCDPMQFVGASCDITNSQSCYVSYAYLDGTHVAGDVSTETIALSNVSTGVPLQMPGFLFGCMNNDTVSFSSTGLVDGIAGFGRGPNSLPSQLAKTSTSNVFSYCLVPYDAATTLTSSLLFGVPNPFPNMVYTPILPIGQTAYWVNMTGISINGTDLGIPSLSFQFNYTTLDGGVIFDSGTTLMFLAPDILAAVVKTLQGLISYPQVTYPPVNGTEYPLCYNLTGVQHPWFPNMSLHFAGVNGATAGFHLSHQNMFVPASVDVVGVLIPGVECLAMYSTAAVENGTGTIMLIGNIAQADHYIEYDVTNLQLGWTASMDCSGLPL